MNFKLQKKLAAKVAKCSPKRVVINTASAEQLKDAITKQDVKGMISIGAIKVKPARGTSRVRARKHQKQKSKGLRRGKGSRKGTKNARRSDKETWMVRIRGIRAFIRTLKIKELISKALYKDLYRKSKGGFFRSKRHIKLYLEERELFTKKTAKKSVKK